MARRPDVSVIIAAYNAFPYLAVTLDSVVRQTLGMRRMEVIAVDDGSTDETPHLLDDFAARHRSATVIHQANSGGPSQPRNTAIAQATGRYVFCLDADDYLSPDALQSMVETADGHDTDVVLARMRGMGGRGTPRIPYTRTMLKTDVFNSPAYWSLNPMKLFRTDLVQREHLRFEHALSRFEDQPFVAGALMGARAISILSDHDYVFWTRRPDEGNITYARVGLADRMPVLDRMFGLVAEKVPPGPGRDKLLRRHVVIELVESAFIGYAQSRDEAARADAFSVFRRIAAEHVTPSVHDKLPPVPRLLLDAVLDGDVERFTACAEAAYGAEHPAVRVVGERVYMHSSAVAAAAGETADDVLDISPSLKADCRLEQVRLAGRSLTVRAECRLGELTELVDAAELVARDASGKQQVAFPLEFSIEDEIVRDRPRPFVTAQAALAVDDLLAALRPGTYKLFIGLAAGGVRREARAVECSLPPRHGRVFSERGVNGRTGRLATTEGGQLTLVVKSGVTGALKSRVRAFSGH